MIDTAKAPLMLHSEIPPMFLERHLLPAGHRQILGVVLGTGGGEKLCSLGTAAGCKGGEKLCSLQAGLNGWVPRIFPGEKHSNCG